MSCNHVDYGPIFSCFPYRKPTKIEPGYRPPKQDPKQADMKHLVKEVGNGFWSDLFRH